jgi:hypothetical protein
MGLALLGQHGAAIFAGTIRESAIASGTTMADEIGLPRNRFLGRRFPWAVSLFAYHYGTGRPHPLV